MVGRKNWLPRCGAYARSTGLPCRRKPVLLPDGRIRNGRCINHGGASSGPKSRAGHDRCTAGRIAYYQRRREAGLPILPRQPKPEPQSVKMAPWRQETEAERKARIIRELNERWPDQDWD